MSAIRQQFIPPGIIVNSAFAVAPPGWLICNFQAVSRTTYAALFNVTGTSYGSGNGTTTFNVPDLRGRVWVGQDNMGGTASGRMNWLYNGSIITGLGAQYHQLQIAEMPSHTHQYAEWTVRTAGSGLQWVASGYTYAVINTAGMSTGGWTNHNNVQTTRIMWKMIKT